MEKEREPFGI